MMTHQAVVPHNKKEFYQSVRMIAKMFYDWRAIAFTDMIGRGNEMTTYKGQARQDEEKSDCVRGFPHRGQRLSRVVVDYTTQLDG
jgi:hypothetical protein